MSASSGSTQRMETVVGSRKLSIYNNMRRYNTDYSKLPDSLLQPPSLPGNTAT
jgi:hypothetical protein